MTTALPEHTDAADKLTEPILETSEPGRIRDNEAWQQMAQPVFVVEDSFYRSRIPRLAHWSIAWSDLMMTMFILFLTLFVHQRTHQDILAHGKPNKVADETIPVQTKDASASLVFHPISQDVTLKTDQLQGVSPPSREQTGSDILIRHQAAEDQKTENTPKAEQQAKAPVPPHETEEVITNLYDLSKVAVANEKLEKFAAIELIPDKAMRIILTGDLLFPSGQADLTADARVSLKKLTAIMQKTPYMINVIGHTDDRPMSSARYPSNWELSLARASQVARFLIEETKMPAGQFSVSGHASFKPVKPNDSEENRRANRRVEIILSKELPQAEPANSDNIQ
jgi:chemotaxis protein MotB